MRYLNNNKKIDQQKRTENPEMDPDIYRQLINYKYLTNKMGVNFIFNNGTRSVDIHMDKMNSDLYMIPYTININSI